MDACGDCHRLSDRYPRHASPTRKRVSPTRIANQPLERSPWMFQNLGLTACHATGWLWSSEALPTSEARQVADDISRNGCRQTPEIGSHASQRPQVYQPRSWRKAWPRFGLGFATFAAAKCFRHFRDLRSRWLSIEHAAIRRTSLSKLLDSRKRTFLAVVASAASDRPGYFKRSTE